MLGPRDAEVADQPMELPAGTSGWACSGLDETLDAVWGKKGIDGLAPRIGPRAWGWLPVYGSEDKMLG